MMNRWMSTIICIAMIILSFSGFASAENNDSLKTEYITCHDYYCPYCVADLKIRKTTFEGKTRLYCLSCGKDLQGFNPIEYNKTAKYEGEYWYCDRCTSFLNNQEGFDDHLGKWKCLLCGHINTISYDGMEAYSWEDFLNKTIERGDIELSDGNYEIALSNYTYALDWAPAILTDKSKTKDLTRELSLNISKCKAYINQNSELQIGQTVWFGHFEQDHYLEHNPEEVVDNGPEPIQWVILDETEDTLTLTSAFPLESQIYHETNTDITWAESSLRTWLNDTFIKTAFFPNELAAIDYTEVDNSNNGNRDGSGTNGGKNTKDRVFVLSAQEYEKYTKNESIHKYLSESPMEYWLRSPGKKQNEVCCLKEGEIKSVSVSEACYVRPVIRINLIKYDWDNDAYTRALQASDLFDAGNYEEAMVIYDSLDDYWASRLCSVDCRMMAGETAFGKGEYKKAYTWYLNAKSFINDSFNPEEAKWFIEYAYLEQKLAECQSKQDSNIDDADVIGDTKDGITTKESKSLIQVHHFDAVTPVNTGKDNGFAESNPIKTDDPHFGWALGNFMVSGFSYKEKNPNGEWVFYRVPGDSGEEYDDNIVLQFDLKQDIDELDGNKSMSIYKDKNRKDLIFQYQGNPFGRGTLLVRHEKFNGQIGNTQQYADYLDAKGSVNANSKIDINEEGYYKVALDYEIASKGLFNRTVYNDYRISLNFTVINGNCAIYAFDIESGAELENGGVTESGFRLNLAESHYLQVNVRRDRIVDGLNGLTLNTSFNGLAKDGVQYTEPGLYTITASIPSTGHKTEKVIYVGDPEEYEEYLSQGDNYEIEEE